MYNIPCLSCKQENVVGHYDINGDHLPEHVLCSNCGTIYDHLRWVLWVDVYLIEQYGYGSYKPSILN